jgi:hypothetical protein
MESKGRSVLDTPLEPVIGLAEGETRWRSMTASARRGLSAVTSEGSDEAIHSFFAALWIASLALAMTTRFAAV